MRVNVSNAAPGRPRAQGVERVLIMVHIVVLILPVPIMNINVRKEVYPAQGPGC